MAEKAKEEMEDAMDSVEEQVQEVKETTSEKKEAVVEEVKSMDDDKKSGSKSILMAAGLAVCFLVVLAVVAFVLVLAGNRGNTTSDAKDIPSDWETYENDFYKVGYPSDWNFEESGSKSLAISSPEDLSEDADTDSEDFDFTDLFGDRVTVIISLANSEDEAFGELDDEDKEKNEKLFDLLEDRDCDEFTKFVKEESGDESDAEYMDGDLNGLDVCTYSSKLNEDEEYSFTSEQYFFVKDGELYSIGFSSYTDKAEDNIEIAKEIIRTFDLKD